jgi:polar amino acid transport system substrate-binding protein
MQISFHYAILKYLRTLTKRAYATCLLASLAVFIAPSAWSNPATSTIESECGSISIGLLEIGSLFFRDLQGNFGGIDKDIVDELSKRTNCKFEIRVESQARIWSQLIDGTLDMSSSGIRTQERMKYAISIAYFSTRNYALLSADIPTESQSIAGFLANPTLRLAVIKGFQHGPQFNEFINQLREQKRVYEVADFESLINLFNAKRINAILALPTSFQALITQKRIVANTIVKDWYPNDNFVAGLFLSKSQINQSRLKIIDNAMKSMQKDGTLEKIFARYVGEKLAKEMLHENINLGNQ